MSNDLQTNLEYIIMIDYDKLRQFFALQPYENFFPLLRANERVKMSSLVDHTNQCTLIYQLETNQKTISIN